MTDNSTMCSLTNSFSVYCINKAARKSACNTPPGLTSHNNLTIVMATPKVDNSGLLCPVLISALETKAIRNGLLAHVTLTPPSYVVNPSFGARGQIVELVELRPIPFTESANYRAGSDGRVYTRSTKGGQRSHRAFEPWYPLKGWTTKKGYWQVLLVHQGVRQSQSLHRCICAAFHGLNTEKDIQVRHLDGNSLNNRPENLKWGTRYENFDDRKAHGTILYGERSNLARFTDVERAHIKWAVSNGLCSQNQAARALGVQPGTINHICNFKPDVRKAEVQPAQQIQVVITETTVSGSEFTIYFDVLTQLTHGR